MSNRFAKMYVKTKSIDGVVSEIKSCVTKNGKRFVRHRKYRLEGIRQTLAFVVGKRRRFLLEETKGWVVVREIVMHTEFADPLLAKWLSTKLKTESLWLKVNEDYNIWAFQRFEHGKLVDENFRPEGYFLAKNAEQAESSDLDSYGWCGDFASRFEKKLKLPDLYLTLAQLKRMPKRFAKVRKIEARIPAS
jgi:hypothetical protein